MKDGNIFFAGSRLFGQKGLNRPDVINANRGLGDDVQMVLVSGK